MLTCSQWQRNRYTIGGAGVRGFEAADYPCMKGFTKFTQLHVVTSQFVMIISCALRARIEDRTGSRHDLVEVNSLL